MTEAQVPDKTGLLWSIAPSPTRAMNELELNEAVRDLDESWHYDERKIQDLWSQKARLTPDQQSIVLKKLLIVLASDEIEGMLGQPDLTEPHKEMLVDRLLRRVGPWKLAESGVLTDLERDLIVRQRVVDLQAVVDHQWELIFGLIAFALLVLVPTALGVYFAEGWYFFSLFFIGAGIVTGQIWQALSAPFRLVRLGLRLRAMRKGRRLSFLGEPEFDLLDRDPLRLDKLTTPELENLAHDNSIPNHKSLPREDLIRALAGIEN